MRSIEWIGYIASLLVFISLLSSSILKLRIINMVGSAIFAVYGFMIHSVPTGLMNTLIVMVNIYYLVKLFRAKELFTVIQTNQDDSLVKHFLDFYQDEITKYSFDRKLIMEKWDVCFFVLRDMSTAGIFTGKKIEDDTLLVALDFVVPEYRDFKVGQYIYDRDKDIFGKLGYKKFLVQTTSKEHIAYLNRMGFVKDEKNEGTYVRNISS